MPSRQDAVQKSQCSTVEFERTPEEDMSETVAMDAQVFAWARRIPAGRVLSYGSLGALCDPPISGYVCGRIMGRIGEDVPWWRIVGKNGNLPIRKRNPQLETEQREKLKGEGIDFENAIDMVRHEWQP